MTNDYKSTPEYKRDQFYNKSRLKLIFIVFPMLIAAYVLAKRMTAMSEYTLMFVILLLGILVVNFGAEYLTRRKFKN